MLLLPTIYYCLCRYFCRRASRFDASCLASSPISRFSFFSLTTIIRRCQHFAFAHMASDYSLLPYFHRSSRAAIHYASPKRAHCRAPRFERQKGSAAMRAGLLPRLHIYALTADAASPAAAAKHCASCRLYEGHNIAPSISRLPKKNDYRYGRYEAIVSHRPPFVSRRYRSIARGYGAIRRHFAASLLFRGFDTLL